MRHPSKQQTSQHVSNATGDTSKGSASNQVKKKSPRFECGLCVCVCVLVTNHKHIFPLVSFPTF